MGGSVSTSATTHRARTETPTAVVAGSWIDLDEVRETLLACVDRDTGAANTAAILAVEYAHNHRIASEMLSLVGHGCRLLVGAALSPDVDPFTRLKAEPCGRLSTATPEGLLLLWERREVADAIAAASILAPMAVSDLYGPLDKRNGRARSLWRQCWLPTATAALRAGPGCPVWTADRIDRVGAVLRALIDLCALRDSGIEHIRAAVVAAGAVSDHALALADTILGISNGAEGTRHIQQSVARPTDVQQGLRDMLSWIDAMECTDVLFDGVLKHHQAERIARMADSDLRLVQH
ncbi:hypothetical protein psal_cds_1110 [Pandoravirus salinus]|uniref:Uncharacterized protein n=1 Tax=Pandoravirus salinus TaxID=1349410 RepID=S4W4S4_9VIRU|nr:hypothetical protein psal_cds_1110 [Pandoravirus salinus]AGO85340.1 hypothetical protein psal_cds_1110 [Pandoravirus salinus]